MNFKNKSNKNKNTVYMYTNKVNSKVYIGRTMRTLQERANLNGQGYKTCPKFWHAICKYGWHNFELTVLAENVSYEESVNLEKYYIEKFKSNTQEYGYNILTQEPNRGSIPQEVRDKISESKKHLTDEQRKRMSESHKGMRAWNKGIKTGPLTEQQKAKFSEARKGNRNSMHNPVKDLTTGNVYRSCAEAGRAIGCTRNAVLYAVAESRPCKGHMFIRIDDKKPNDYRTPA